MTTRGEDGRWHYTPAPQTEAEIEEMRLERIADRHKSASDDGEEDKAFRERAIAYDKLNIPGSHGWSMAYHLASVMADMVESHLQEDVAVVHDPVAYRYATRAWEGLWDLYQHMAAEDQNHEDSLEKGELK